MMDTLGMQMAEAEHAARLAAVKAGYEREIERLTRELADYRAACEQKQEIINSHKAVREAYQVELAEAKDKALRFDLDQAGIEGREREAVELVHLRAENKAAWDSAEYNAERARKAEAGINALRELVALVRGECPALLDESRGGNARLSIAIDAAIDAGRV